MLTSAANPRIRRAATLREARQRQRTGMFLAEGLREVERAAAAGLVCIDLLTDHDYPGAERVEPALFRTLCYREDPEGVLGVFEQPRWDLDTMALPHAAMVLVVVGSEKPGNLGAMVRTAAAAGASAVLSVEGVVDLFNPNAIRSSTGAIFALPTFALDRAAAIRWLTARSIPLLPLVVDAPRSVFEADLTGPVAMVIGPEHAGLPPEWAHAAGGVHIPMSTKMSATVTDSLNASVAAGVVLFEAVRQRARLTRPSSP